MTTAIVFVSTLTLALAALALGATMLLYGGLNASAELYGQPIFLNYGDGQPL